MASRNAQTVIIKRVKVKGHGGHHGGAWKVAYADFVTAMMSFFLLLWLLNVTTDVQKRGIADYFAPSISSQSESGAGGVLGGATVGPPGSQVDPSTQVSVDFSHLALGKASDSDDDSDDTNSGGTAGTNPDKQNAGDQPGKAKLSDKDLEAQLAVREEKRFEDAEKALRDAIKDVPALQKLADNLIIDNTPEGLRIQLVDQDNQPMFPLGSAEMLDPAKKLMSLVSQIVLRLPNKVAITGHTDSTPYPIAGKYSNWELSSDRANASRREFAADGVPSDRIARVSGLADQEPLDAKNPAAPRNRRISIVLLREAKELPPGVTPK
jgi:chemotaxis protein MotB